MCAKTQKKTDSKMLGYVKKYVNIKFAKELIFNPDKLYIVSFFILLAELFLNIYIIQKVKYTEIDWIAYMQECEGFINGTLDYTFLKGDTGPLVYPAGFLYIYSILYYMTSGGRLISLAQYIFLGIYLCQMSLVLRLYIKSRKVPPYVLVLCALTSYRVHSIYMLRLFNDPVAILFLYASLNLYMDSKWTYASVLLSIAVSVKMNILLFAPALLLFLLVNLGLIKTIVQLTICAAVQLLLALPFLITNPVAYIKGSFDFGRVFDHKWTVNYRFLHIDIFEHKYFHIGLLVLHILLLIAFFPICFKYMQSYVRLRTVQKQFEPQIKAKNRETNTARKINKADNTLDKKVEDDEQEIDKLTVEQQKFINAFEKGIKKSSQSSAGSVSGTKSVPPESKESVTTYSVHFDSVTQLALLPIFLSNLIGVACARSLHYQFYVWYFHSLPHLVWSTTFSIKIRLLLLALIEYSWNTYPSTDISSCVLHICHITIIWGIYKNVRMLHK